MPGYQKFVGLAFDVAKAKGASFETTNGPPENSAAIMEIAAKLWTKKKDEIKPMTNAQARQLLEGAIQVQ